MPATPAPVASASRSIFHSGRPFLRRVSSFAAPAHAGCPPPSRPLPEQVWAQSDDGLPKFELLTAKDRLSPNFDAEGGEMYRYVLLVGQMTGDGGGALMNVEIQLHVKRLTEMRKTLHILYDGRRALRANEDEVATHEGELTKAALERASKGIVTRLRCEDSQEKVPKGTVEALAAVLQASPCMLTELSLTSTQGFEGVELGNQLLLPADSGQMNCFRLRRSPARSQSRSRSACGCTASSCRTTGCAAESPTCLVS
jgi:hypothetical protein